MPLTLVVYTLYCDRFKLRENSKAVNLQILIFYSMTLKICSSCKLEKDLFDFNKCKTNKDGYHYQCKSCRKIYNDKTKSNKKEYNQKYYQENKDNILKVNKDYRDNNVETISIQRKIYRSLNKEKIQQKNKEYLPIRKEKIKLRRQIDLNFKLTEILRSKIHKMLKGEKNYSSYIGCDIEHLKKWLEFQFDDKMNWDNLGSYWEIDHIIAINQFDFSKEENKYICFNWTNLQPLTREENRDKSDKLLLHYYFNSIITIHRFIQKYKNYVIGYQNVNKSLHWLREKLRYGKNATDKNE